MCAGQPLIFLIYNINQYKTNWNECKNRLVYIEAYWPAKVFVYILFLSYRNKFKIILVHMSQKQSKLKTGGESKSARSKHHLLIIFALFLLCLSAAVHLKWLEIDLNNE